VRLLVGAVAEVGSSDNVISMEKSLNSNLSQCLAFIGNLVFFLGLGCFFLDCTISCLEIDHESSLNPDFFFGLFRKCWEFLLGNLLDLLMLYLCLSWCMISLSTS